jgi:hypothetical protein
MPPSQWIGIDSNGHARNVRSHYSPKAPSPENLTFDISNNQLLASLEPSGEARFVAIVERLDRSQLGGFELRGVPGSKKLKYGGPWSVKVEPAKLLSHAKSHAVDYEQALLPVFHHRADTVAVEQRVFAPISEKRADSPRALIYRVELTNTGTEQAHGTVEAEADTPKKQAGVQALLLLDDTASGEAARKRHYDLAPGAKAVFSFAFVLGETEQEVARTEQLLRSKSADAWLEQTRRQLVSRVGQLRIPDDTFWPEFLVRMIELCRQPIMYKADGTSGGTFIGSNLQANEMWNANLWMKDCFYEVLPMAMLAPELCADAIPFFLDWGMPEKPYGRGLERFPNAAPETHSLSLSLAPFILAGKYYESTGDRAYFKAYPKLLESARHRLQTILASRQDPEVYLFPSMYVSDGDARGDWHTGANLLAWYSFQSMARIAAEAYGDAALAAEWKRVANLIARDIRARCIGPSAKGPRYFEGANRNGTFEIEKDGEESDMALMPFYGFTTPDDPALIRHHQSGMSTENPLYSKALDAIWWFDNSWHGATFPAWMTALAAVTNETDLAARLDRIATLADMDGSVWWWAYKYGEKDRKDVVRGPVKCAWAAGVFVCKFIHDIVGLRVDVPARRVEFRPFHPWPSLSWESCRIGHALFDVAEQKSEGAITATVRNRNAEAYDCVIELTLPPGATMTECLVNGRPAQGVTTHSRFGRNAIRLTQKVDAGQSLTVTMRHGIN